MFTVTFWKQAAERAIKSFAQGYIGVGTVVTKDGFFSLDSLKGAVAMALASVLTSLASSFKGDGDSPSLV